MQKRAIKYQTELAPKDCDAAFLAALDSEVNTSNDSIDEVKAAEKDRLEGTGKRIEASNEIYTESEIICNTAKDVYRETNPH